MLIIPAIDLIDGQCVRLLRGDYDHQSTYASDPVKQALKFEDAGFRRLHLVDLQGARSGRSANRATIGRILEAVSLPVQIGGGIRRRQDIDELIDLGASFLIVGTVAVEEPDLLRAWIREWGSDRFIVSLDLRRGRVQSRGWQHEPSLSLEDVVKQCTDWGISQLICTDVEQDGTLEQPGYQTLHNLKSLLPKSVTLIAAGGVTHPEQLRRLEKMGLGGAVIGRALYEGTVSLEDFVGAC